MINYKQLIFRALVCIFPVVLTAQENAPQPQPTTVTVERASPLSISGALEICKGSETILKAEGDFESFSWDRGGVTGRYLKVKEEGVYEVTARTKAGCSFTTKVTVRFRPCTV